MNEWDSIAGEWHKYRQRPMPEILPFLEEMKNKLPLSAKVLEVGCGTGRNLLFFGNDFVLSGCDASKEMLNLCPPLIKKKTCNLPNTLPYEDNTFDAVMSIAVLHHLHEGYERAVSELLRVAKPSAFILVSVWNLHEHLPKKDIYKRWGDTQRYYYVFEEDEFFSLFKAVKEISRYVGRNLIFFGKKE